MLHTTGPLLRPAVRLMQRMSLPVKMAVIASLIAVPLIILTSRMLIDTQAQLRFTRNEVAGSQLASALLNVAVLGQMHRGQTNMAMSGNASADTMLSQTTRPKLKEALARADALVQAHSEWGLATDWQPIQTQLSALASGERSGGDKAAVFQAHTAQIRALRLLMSLLGERSELLFDPEASTFFLMDLPVERMLPFAESAGLLRGQGAGLLVQGSAEPAEMATVHGRLATLREQVDMIQSRVAALQRAGEPVPAGFNDMIQRTQAYAAMAQGAFSQAQPQGDAADYFAAGTLSIESMVGFTRACSERLSSLLAERNQRLTHQRNLALGGTLVGLLGLIYFAAGFYFSTMHAVKRVEATVRAGAAGDLTARAEIEGQDEFSAMGRELDTMFTQLAQLVTDIRSQADGVATTGEQIARHGQDLSRRTTHQAANVEQSAATLAEVAETVQGNAGHVERVDQLFGRVRQTGESGRERMERAVSTIETMAATSRQVGEIVSVIDGIAFQTNILALNAAVEAARAGESGRGFAVVANEVRTLAQRSATAAGEIRQLITSSVDQVAQGVAEIRHARDSMGEVLQQVHGVSGAMSELATATQQQSSAVRQVSSAVRDIGDVTSQNVQSVEESSQAAESLRRQALNLMHSVDRLKTAA
jgi:methyl-accepting chemotaxis protein